MSVLIRGMTMPKSCAYHDDNEQLILCPLLDIDAYCGACGMNCAPFENARPSFCPLVELPPHGRLIDADAIGMNYIHIRDDGMKIYTQRAIDNAPTIIPAEEGE